MMMRIDSPRAIERPDVSRVFNLINNREWEALTRIIKSDPSVTQVGIHGNRSTETQLALHEACKQQPPLDVLDVLIRANPSALKVKGQFGCTPLHWAVSYSSSAEVVAKLIQSYPPGTRVRDDINQVLPIHLAAKYAVKDDVVLEILTAHPEGFFIRDGDGLTPLDYANQLRLPSDRERLKNVLNHAPLLCKVSKAAQVRVAHEQEAKLRSIQESHTEQLRHWEQRYTQEKLKAKSRSHSLKDELDAVTSLADTASQQLEEKVSELTELTEKCVELEARLEKERKQFRNTLDVRQAEMQTLIDAEKERSNELLQRIQENEAEISKLQVKNESLETIKTNLDVELNSEREVTEMMVEEVEKLRGMELLVSEMMTKVMELESKVDTGNATNETMSKNMENMEIARSEVEDKWSQTKAELDKERKSNADLTFALEESKRVAELYMSRNGQIRGWFQRMSEDMDSWGNDETTESSLLRAEADKLNGENVSTLPDEVNNDVSFETVEDTVETPYSGVELSLERIAEVEADETVPQLSPTAQYRTRISPVNEEGDRFRAENAPDDEKAQEVENSFDAPTASDSLDEASITSKELIHYFSGSSAVSETMQTATYTVSTVDDESSD